MSIWHVLEELELTAWPNKIRPRVICLYALWWCARHESIAAILSLVLQMVGYSYLDTCVIFFF